MNKIFSTLRRLLAELARPEATVDLVSAMSPREFADLPIYHPRLDT